MPPRTPFPFRLCAAIALGVIVLAQSAVRAQQADSTYRMPYATRHDGIGLLAGYVQGRHAAAEIGLARNIHGTVHHPYSFDYFVAAELSGTDRLLTGVKAGLWVAGGAAMGLQAIWYTDGAGNAAVLRPELGIGLATFKVTYGYNVRLAGEDFDRLNTHVLNVTYCFTLLRLREERPR